MHFLIIELLLFYRTFYSFGRVRQLIVTRVVIVFEQERRSKAIYRATTEVCV